MLSKKRNQPIRNGGLRTSRKSHHEIGMKHLLVSDVQVLPEYILQNPSSFSHWHAFGILCGTATVVAVAIFCCQLRYQPPSLVADSCCPRAFQPPAAWAKADWWDMGAPIGFDGFWLVRPWCWWSYFKTPKLANYQRDEEYWRMTSSRVTCETKEIWSNAELCMTTLNTVGPAKTSCLQCTSPLACHDQKWLLFWQGQNSAIYEKEGTVLKCRNI